MKLRNKKTGAIVEAYKEEPIDLFFYLGTDEEGDELDRKTYHSLSELNEEWEDYKPAEPLIKDEKVRKAVRAWAEANELKPDYEVKYDADRYGLISWQADINFNFRIEGLEHNKKYIIDELCGEEK